MISEEEKAAQAQANNDMAAMGTQQSLATVQQHNLEQTGWGQHTEFIAAYLPSWSVFGAEAKPENEAQTSNNNNAQNGTMA